MQLTINMEMPWSTMAQERTQMSQIMWKGQMLEGIAGLAGLQSLAGRVAITLMGLICSSGQSLISGK